jgi:hypothetical protein
MVANLTTLESSKPPPTPWLQQVARVLTVKQSLATLKTVHQTVLQPLKAL